MFIVIGFMFSGILVGYLLRNRKLSFVNSATTVLIWILLLFLGIEVGENRDVIKALPVIGIEAIFITLAALLGSLIAAWVLWRRFANKKRG